MTLSFQAQVSTTITSPTVITNQAQLSGARTATFGTTLIVNGRGVWVPVARR